MNNANVNENLNDNIGWLLLRAAMVAKQRLMKISETHDLAPMQAFTLCLLEIGEAVPMSSISGLLACDPSNVTGIVDRLLQGGYIDRRESTIDRRVKTISLTPTGQTLRSHLLEEITKADATNLKNLTTDEVTSLKALLLKTLPTPIPPKHRSNI